MIFRKVCLWLTLLMGGMCAPSSYAATLTGFHLEVGATAERIAILTDAKLTPKASFMLQKPDRMVLDFNHFKVGKVSLPDTYRGRLIRGIRSGAYDANTTRLVFDLSAPVKVLANYHVEPEGKIWRYVIDIQSKNGAPPVVAPPKPSVPAKPKIAVDAGHGGQDPGARGKQLIEKQVTFKFAGALVKRLNDSGRYQAFLVRANDRFIALHDRVKIARAKKADVFISLHADSNPNPKARGLSLYTLSETASDAEAEALAARENKSDIIEGVDFGATDADVADILIELAQRETMSQSATLAKDMLAGMPRAVTLLVRPHRYAGFRVLKAPDIPSVLVELGFLSSPQDERMLASANYAGHVSNGILKGLDQYFKRKKAH